MRKLLDTFLLKLLHEWEEAPNKQDGKVEAERKVVTLIDFVSDDALFHRIVVEELIKKSVCEMAINSLQKFHDKINHAISYAIACATTDVARGRLGVAKKFVEKLAEALKNDMPYCRNTWLALQRTPLAYIAGEGRLEFENIVLPGLRSVVDATCNEFLQSMLMPNGLRDLADKVEKALQSHDNESFRPRCTMACPLCGATCFLPAFHQGSHDTLHQPQGLKGTVWQHNGQLSEKSCSEHYRDEDEFILGTNQQQDQICGRRKDYQRLNSYRDFKTGNSRLAIAALQKNYIRGWHCI
ncbi:hypothetical protein L7F22_055417 [Adiantum nelumboides]|nr:hypothetical protein [Adiantum nelumboides]